MAIYAVLIDTVSIQRYVFGSNKLKENLGASHLIQNVYKGHLERVANSIFNSQQIDFKAWREKKAEYLINRDDVQFEVGYIGGGNALLFFMNKDKAEKFIKEWTKILLIETPGIVTAVACEEFNLDDDKFETENKKLFKKLQENKYKFIPQTIIPRHGITAECSHTGYSMEEWSSSEDKYISSVAHAKIEAADKATEELKNKFKDILDEKYCFTNQLDELGQQKGEDSHIAIVHIDGNGMGERFRGTKSLKEIRELSDSVENATNESFRHLLSQIDIQFSKIKETLGYGERKKYPEENGRKILPIRPIIIGGDDITFVCDGRLGVYFAKIFLEAFERHEVSDGKKLSACAGVAITKTKYPFYRGYELSEQLCKNAKKVRKDKQSNGSWLDFHIAYGGFSGTLEEIRISHYRSPQGELCFRPYKIGSKDEYSFKSFVENTKKLKKFPNSKIKELRQVLTLGEAANKTFVQEMEARGLELPKIDGRSYEDKLFQDSKTPYFDMIELMEFYPSFELKDDKGEGAK